MFGMVLQIILFDYITDINLNYTISLSNILLSKFGNSIRGYPISHPSRQNVTMMSHLPATKYTYVESFAILLTQAFYKIN